jgi:hypothetical protein
VTSFHSKKYPSSRNGLLVLQGYAMNYFAGINLVLMLGILVRIVSHGAESSLIWWAIVGEAFAVAMGNLLAYAKLKRTYAEIFFVNEHFSLISVYEILFKRENNAFPTRYANPSLTADQETLTIHFNDQIITLKRQDWDEFDLIRDYFYAKQF